MKNSLAATGRLAGLVLILTVALHLAATPVLAGAESNGWRSTCDTAMLWVNFAILAFVIVKFGRKPIMGFLRGRKDDLQQQIRYLEDKREQAQTDVREIEQKLADSDAVFEKLKQHTLAGGEKKKQAFVEEARQQSQYMFADARRRIDNQIRQAQNTFRAELVDAAIDRATERLPQEMTSEDNRNLVQHCFATARPE